MDDPATRVDHALLDVQINERTRDSDTALLGLVDKRSSFGRRGEEVVENDALSGLQCLPNPRNELPQRSASVISAESDRGGHAFAELLRQRGLATGGRPHDEVDDWIGRRRHGSVPVAGYAVGDHFACDPDNRIHQRVTKGHGAESDR